MPPVGTSILCRDSLEQNFPELPPTGLDEPIHDTLGPCYPLVQEYHEIEHSWKVANWAYKTRDTFGDTKRKRKHIKQQTSGILYLALYLIWSISSKKLVEDSAVTAQTSSSKAVSSQVRLLQQDDSSDHRRQSSEMQDDNATAESAHRQLLEQRSTALENAVIEASRRMKWIRLYEPDFTFAKRSYKEPQILYMTYDSCQAAMRFIREDEECSTKSVLRYRVADLEAIKDWWGLLQLGRREFNDFQGTEGEIAKGKDECEEQKAILQERIDRVKACKV